MKGFIKYTEREIQQATDLVNQINDCLGLPADETITWDTPTAMCSLDASSAYTQFWGYVVKVDTEQLTDCLTEPLAPKSISVTYAFLFLSASG